MLENLTVDNLIKKITTWFNKDRKIIFWVTFLIGMLVHFELYSQELLAYDAYWHYGSFLAKGWEISLGRFLIPFIDLFRGTVVVSILSTAISMFAISLTAIILVDLLKIKKTYLKILIGILLAVTPTFSLTLMYAYTADSYAFAMLFSVLSVYFLNKDSSLKNLFLALTCVVITLGFYQAYLSVTVTLCVIVYLLRILTEENLRLKDLLKHIAIDVSTVLLGIIIYFIGFMIIVKILNLSVTSYNGGNTIFSLDTLKNLLPSIKNTYITFYEFYFKDTILKNPNYWHKKLLNLILFSFILINFVILIIQNKTYKKAYKIVFTILALLSFPIFLCVIELIAQTRKIDLLMASSLYLPFVLLIKQIELLKISKLNNVINLLSTIMVCILIWTFVLSDNATYVAKSIYNKQIYSLGNRILQEVQNNENITSDTPICIAGKIDFSIYNSRLLLFTNFDVTDINTWTWQIFLQDNLALGRTICSFDTYETIVNSSEYNEMGIFPEKNSIQLIDGVAVIKVGY